MRKVDRSKVAVPQSLCHGAAGAEELQKARDHQVSTDPDKKAFVYKVYKRDDVRAALENLFHGKCAYCETLYDASGPVDIEHYRPKGAVAEDNGHSGYWWVAMEWTNLLPSCLDCNRRRGQVLVEPSTSLAQLAALAKPLLTQAGKKDSFPLAATGVRALAEAVDFTAEHALLLDPCRDDPDSCLTFSFDQTHAAGLVLPAGDGMQQTRGAVSIQTYGLNRLKLVQDRIRVLRRLEFLGDLVIELAAAIVDLDRPDVQDVLEGTSGAKVQGRLRLLRDRILAEMKSHTKDDAPYSAMAKAWLRSFTEKLR
ncbi:MULTISPECIES: HNH endonuclease family protein [unclassified Cupriavidus]|uniref:hypothetical protein n=1 Tax=Cupriavidus sp. H19C3 TaxID=3241603 RepID=UPI003BF8F572